MLLAGRSDEVVEFVQQVHLGNRNAQDRIGNRVARRKFGYPDAVGIVHGPNTCAPPDFDRGLLRHPSWKGLRVDLDCSDVALMVS